MLISQRQLPTIFSKKESLSCIVISLPENVKSKVKKWAKEHIDKEDLFYISKGRGLEPHVHITVKYGLYTNDASEVKSFLKEQEPVDVKLGPISKFRDVSDEFDVLKVEAYGEDLQAFNKAVSKKFKHKESRKRYLPHITLAYVKKGACDDLVGKEVFEGLKFQGSKYVFLDDDSEPHTIQVKASRIDYIKEDLPEEFWNKANGSYTLKPEIESHIKQRIGKALSSELKGIDKWLTNLFIGSSIATQFWKEDTDIDLKAIIDEAKFKEFNPQYKHFKGEVLLEKILEVFDQFKGTDVFTYQNHPFELYPATLDEVGTKEFMNRFDSLYDVNNKKWLKEVNLLDPDDYDRDEVVEEGEEMAMEWAHKWDMDLGKIRRKVKEFELVVQHLKHLTPERRKIFMDKMENLKEGLLYDIEKMHGEKEKVKKEYNESYKSYDEDLEKYYGSVNALPEVIRIKMLNMWGYIAIIKSLNNIIKDEESIDAGDIKDIKEAINTASIISFRSLKHQSNPKWPNRK